MVIYAASPAIFLHEKNVQPGEASYRRTNASLDGLGKSGRSEPRNVLKKSPVPRCLWAVCWWFWCVFYLQRKLELMWIPWGEFFLNFTPHLPIKKKQPSHMSNFYWGRNNKKNSRTFQPMDPVGKAKIECTTVTRHPPKHIIRIRHTPQGEKSDFRKLWKRSFKVVFLLHQGGFKLIPWAMRLPNW